MRIGNIVPMLTKLYANPATRMRAVFLLGASGIGKSQTVWQTAENRGIPVIDLRLSQCDPTDLRGVPSVVNGKTVWNPPSFFPDETTPAGILFLDEITSAPPAVQAPAYQLVLDRGVGDYKLPDGWMIVAAGNRANDRGVTFNIAAPLLNRMTLVNVDTVLSDWIEHAASKEIVPEVLAFVSDRPDQLHKFDKDTYGQQFPSPRSWFAVSNIYKMGFPAEERVELIKGAVGHEAAVTFEQFLRVYETMPSLDKIFADPDSVAVPAELNVRYCVAMGLSARLDRKNFGAGWQFIKRMPAEFQTLIVKLAYQRDNSLVQAPMFAEWSIQNQHAFRRV